jgi:hypothetical protein
MFRGQRGMQYLSWTRLCYYIIHHPTTLERNFLLLLRFLFHERNEGLSLVRPRNGHGTSSREKHCCPIPNDLVNNRSNKIYCRIASNLILSTMSSIGVNEHVLVNKTKCEISFHFFSYVGQENDFVLNILRWQGFVENKSKLSLQYFCSTFCFWFIHSHIGDGIICQCYKIRWMLFQG